jgi:hypothetical protein
MTSITRDPLLAIAKGVLWFLMGVLALAALACLVAVPALAIFHGAAVAKLAEQAPDVPAAQLLWAIGGILLLTVLMSGLLFRIFQLLKHIVDTVAQGDPFVPDNAGRLTQMAWFSLAVQVIGLPMSAIGAAINGMVKGHGHTDLTVVGGIDGNGLLLMLILFILARVFRKGAQMRADLDGMV